QLKDTTKYLDAWIPETKVLIEHKSRGIKLDAPQSGHGGKTPYEQALDYNIARPFSEKARWIVTSNFDEIWVYDMDHPLDDPQKISLADLPKEVSRLGFLVDSQVKSVRVKEKDISIKAGRIVGELYRELLKRYAEPNSSETLKHLNRLCVRLVFLFYAEDADLFPKDAFWTLLKETPAAFLRQRLLTLFRALDTPEPKRDPYLEPEIAAFPYTNGGLFKNVADTEVPPLDDEIRELLIKSSDFDWRDISPTIFGALFESTLNPETRRAGGMVYTSVENIHKVIDPLFMNDLTAELESIKSERAIAVRRAKAAAFQEKLGSFKFLDPACGSGNFLTETFISLRKLENEAIVVGERLKPGEVLLNLDGIVKVSIKQFHGIEINDFAVSVAKTAMWISEAKMLNETANILHAPPKYLPLQDYDGIVEGNALRIDWGNLLAAKNAENAKIGFDYIMGNPPFIGARNKSKEQAADMEAVFGEDWKSLGNLDYVTAWYKKAMDILATKNTQATKVAFVSTNSICQGDGVAALWKPLFAQGLEIDFAHRTFRWDSEATEKAHVHCVIVGFHCKREGSRRAAEARRKAIFDGNRTISAAHINGYLMDAPDAWIESCSKPICDVPPLVFGSMPNDGGFLSDWSDEDKMALVKKYPAAEALFRRFMGATEFINKRIRWCLWLKDASPAAMRAVPPVMEAVENVQKMRAGSSRAGTRKLAETPTLFGEIRQPDSDYLIVPRHSSENRTYIPLGYFHSDTICGDSCMVLPSATLYHFGVLTSSVHMAWMRAVAGRLKSDYRYSANIVYNNFPWPDNPVNPVNPVKDKISQTAQSILDARARYPESSLADLYDPLTMPPDLRAAHVANDRAVLAAYGLKPDTPEPEIVAHLLKLYAEMTRATRGTQRTERTKETDRSLKSLSSLASLSSEGGVANG
ncbi:MAG: class I SAM-dependent DNA methyltransferase, partial [Kiritimatiellae bacterium]|nr:class I SAM-dependent DNA methyltransferase [Kiritimatiellia bacterium]